MWKIYNQAKDNQEAEILLYDTIADVDSPDYGFVSAKNIITQIKNLGDVKNITLRINSDGGDVFQALAIYNTLKEHKANITVKIDGIAASAASVIAMAGDKIIMPENTMLMLHNPAGGCFGEAEDMRALAEVLDKIRDSLVKAYVAKSKLKPEQVIDLMNAETYLTANEAKALNFCDEVTEKLDIAARMRKITGCLSSFTEGEIEKFRNEGRIAERERIRALDGLRAPGRQEIIDRAKYDEPKDIKDIALELLQADDIQARLNAHERDAAAINDVMPSREHDAAKEALDNIVENITMNLNRKRGYLENGR